MEGSGGRRSRDPPSRLSESWILVSLVKRVRVARRVGGNGGDGGCGGLIWGFDQDGVFSFFEREVWGICSMLLVHEKAMEDKEKSEPQAKRVKWDWE